MRELTHTEDTFIREVIREVNHRVVMQGTDYCEHHLRHHANHLDCPHFRTCLVYWRVAYAIRLGKTVVEKDFRLESLDEDFPDYE